MADTLTEQFDALIVAHGLINLSVSRASEAGHDFWSASAQAFHQGSRICGQAIAKTPELALSGALADIAEQRSPDYVPDQLVAA